MPLMRYALWLTVLCWILPAVVAAQTLPRDDLNYDWAGWGNPVVATRETARERPPAGAFNAS